jgi:hypothetical protein
LFGSIAPTTLRAMLRVVQGRADRVILASADIHRVGA